MKNTKEAKKLKFINMILIFNCDNFELSNLIRELKKKYKIIFILKDNKNASVFCKRV